MKNLGNLRDKRAPPPESHGHCSHGPPRVLSVSMCQTTSHEPKTELSYMFSSTSAKCLVCTSHRGMAVGRLAFTPSHADPVMPL